MPTLTVLPEAASVEVPAEVPFEVPEQAVRQQSAMSAVSSSAINYFIFLFLPFIKL